MTEFIYFDVSNKKDPRAITIQNQLKAVLKSVSGVEDIKDVQDLNPIFDEIEKMNELDKTNLVHLVLDKYYNLSDTTKFNKAIEKQLSRKSFNKSRSIIFCAADGETSYKGIKITTNYFED